MPQDAAEGTERALQAFAFALARAAIAGDSVCFWVAFRWFRLQERSLFYFPVVLRCGAGFGFWACRSASSSVGLRANSFVHAAIYAGVTAGADFRRLMLKTPRFLVLPVAGGEFLRVSPQPEQILT